MASPGNQTVRSEPFLSFGYRGFFGVASICRSILASKIFKRVSVPRTTRPRVDLEVTPRSRHSRLRPVDIHFHMQQSNEYVLSFRRNSWNFDVAEDEEVQMKLSLSLQVQAGTLLPGSDWLQVQSHPSLAFEGSRTCLHQESYILHAPPPTSITPRGL